MNYAKTREELFEGIAGLKFSSDIKFKNEFENSLYREMLMTEEKEVFNEKMRDLLRNYMDIRLEMSQGHPDYQRELTDEKSQSEFADFLRQKVISELSLNVDPDLYF